MDMTTPQTSEHPVGEQQPEAPVDVQEAPRPAFGLAGETSQPVAEEPVAEESAPRPAVEEPAPEPVMQEAVVQEAVAPQPVAQESVVEEQPQPMVQEPVVQEPVVEEQPQPEAQVPPQPLYDKEGQFEKVQAGLLQGEQIIAVYDIKGVGDGMVGITNMRLIIQDNSFVGGKVALTSVPYGRIHAVSYLADKSMFGKFFSESSICVTTSGHDYVMEFRSVEKAKHIHDVVLAYAMGA